jgi:hypothetical protein
MSWSAIRHQLYVQSHQLHAAASQLTSMRTPDVALIRQHGMERAARMMIRDMMEEQDKATDLACEHFASTGQWPLMSQDATFAVFQRIATARDLADFVLYQFAKIPVDVTAPVGAHSDSDLWRWVLIDYWQRAGRQRWLSLASL